MFPLPVFGASPPAAPGVRLPGSRFPLLGRAGLSLAVAWTALPAAISATPVDFRKDIAPILTTHCAECHGPNVQKGKISLQNHADLLGEGEWKAAVVSGQPEASRLLRSVSGPEPQMPKTGPKLTPAEVALLRQWIAEGAAWPEDYVLQEKVSAAGTLWSFQAPATGTPPTGPGLPRHPVDAFIHTRLAEEGLAPAPEADRRTLIRRLSFDLHGLPPSPSEVAAFTSDPSPLAYENLVDRLLASPRYGERWARHWLDIAHYADTHGFERDQKRDFAWPYRDYVIRSFNTDLPYDQFLREQIAGDVIAPDRAEAVIATGFLAAGPWDKVGHDETPSPVLKRAARADDLDDMVTQVITSTLGLTINCARCHNHKIDPISQADYYRLWAVFTGVTRGEKTVPPAGGRPVLARRAELARLLQEKQTELAALAGRPVDLALAVSLGGKPGSGINAATGKIAPGKQGYLTGVKGDTFHRPVGTDGRLLDTLVDGVFIPHRRVAVTATSTGIKLRGLPATSGQAWDAIRQGPVQSQAHTRLDGVDYAGAGHSLLGLHANAGITFDVRHASAFPGSGEVQFSAVLGYGGGNANAVADFHVFVDGEPVFQQRRLGRRDGARPVRITLPSEARFLTLVATDGGDGIGHDQLIVGDPHLTRLPGPENSTPEHLEKVARLEGEIAVHQRELDELPMPGKIYGPVPGTPSVVKVLARGSPESPAEPVAPGGLSSLTHASADFGTDATPEGERRRRLAEWITHPENPLTARVMVNRLWHHHFGRGLVETPSDFGQGGGRPSHPALLDWLARDFMAGGWKLKRVHRLLVTSATYRQTSSVPGADRAVAKDASNRLLWRMNPRRLDAESVRDAVLAVSGSLNPAMGGPGYQDFTYQDAYAPIYTHITPDRPDLWRRSVYRFIVRTTPNRFLSTLDCPDPTNMTPARLTTTTALQALSLMNHDFMLQQAAFLARQAQEDAGLSPSPEASISRAFQRVFQRDPEPEELAASVRLVQAQGLAQLCRLLLNTNEFVLAD